MNILILGGAGFLGNNLIRRCLKDKKNKILVVDSLESRLKSTTKNLKEIWSQIKFIKGDIRNQALMNKVVRDKDVVFNCASQSSHPISLKDPFFDVQINCLGNLTLLEALKQHNKKALVIHISSSTIIGKASGKIVDETLANFPLDICSANQGVIEKYYHIYNQVHGLNTLSLRFANLYGPYGKGYSEFGFINYFISLARKNKEIKIFGSGKQLRNVMYVEDATEILYQCILHKKIFGNVYFAVHQKHYSVIDIAKEIISVFGKGKIKRVKWPGIRKRIEIGDVVISSNKLYKKIKFKPKYNLREGLKRTKEVLTKT